MNESTKTATEVAKAKLCTAFYPEDILAKEHDLIKNAFGRTGVAEELVAYAEELVAYIDGIVNFTDAILADFPTSYAPGVSTK